MYFLNWSGGKDAALALWTLKQQGIAVSRLLTSVSGAHDRVSMHGVPRSLVAAQAEAMGLPLQVMSLPQDPAPGSYEEVLQSAHESLKADGYTHAVYGDIFLEDLRIYREGLLQEAGLNAVFPLWGRGSDELLESFWGAGFRAVVVCVNEARLPASFCGRELDRSFRADLPAGVDPCGENGEFHTFVYDGPLFSRPVSFTRGNIHRRSYPAPKRGDCFGAPDEAIHFSFSELQG